MKCIIVVLCLGTIVETLCMSIVSPYLPHESVKKGLSVTQFAMAFAAFSLSRILCGAFWAKMMNAGKVGSRCPFVGGMMLTGYCTVLLGILQFSPGGVKFLIYAILLRIVEALGTTSFHISLYAIIQNEFTADPGSAFSVIETTSSIAYILSLPLAGFLYQLGGFYLPFVLYGGVAVALSFPSCIILPNYVSRPEERGGCQEFLGIHGVLVALVLVGIARLSFTFMSTILELAVIQLGNDYVIVGAIFSGNRIAYVIAVTIVGAIARKMVWVVATVQFGLILKFLAFLLWTSPFLLPNKQCFSELYSKDSGRHVASEWLFASVFIQTTLQLTILVVLSGIADALLQCGSFVLMKNLALKHGFGESMSTYSVVSSVYNISLYIGSFIGSILGGVLVDHLGGIPQAAFVMAGAYAILVILCPIFLVDAARKVSHIYHNEENLPTPDPTIQETALVTGIVPESEAIPQVLPQIKEENAESSPTESEEHLNETHNKDNN